MVGACGGEGVGPLREVGGEEGARKGKVYDTGAANEGHGKPSKNTRDVQQSEPQFSGPVEIGGRGSYLILFKDPKGVGRGVMNVEVPQR